MSDLIIGILATLAIWTLLLYDIETKREIKELREVNSLLFSEGMAITARLNRCKMRSKRCKHIQQKN